MKVFVGPFAGPYLVFLDLVSALLLNAQKGNYENTESFFTKKKPYQILPLNFRGGPVQCARVHYINFHQIFHLYGSVMKIKV